jgi:hypothetical protein
MRFPIKITEQFILEPVLHLFGVKPESSYVDIADGKLDVRMGIWFHEEIPLAEVKHLAPSDWPWWGGLGVKLIPHGVGVVGSLDGVVLIELAAPRKMRVLFPVEADRLAISIADRDGFLAELSNATGLTVAPHVPFSLTK